MNIDKLTILRNLNAMVLDETIDVLEHKVTRVRQVNGRMVWSVNGWICRSADRVLSWIVWSIKQHAKHGHAR